MSEITVEEITELLFTPFVQAYIDSVDGKAHQSAVEIIERLEKENQSLKALLGNQRERWEIVERWADDVEWKPVSNLCAESIKDIDRKLK